MIATRMENDDVTEACPKAEAVDGVVKAQPPLPKARAANQ